MPPASSYSQEVADALCERIACGESLRTICSDAVMPAMSTVFKWLGEQPAFSEQYARAREEQAETLADEIVSIADECGTKVIVGEGEDAPIVVFDATAVARNRLRVDARKWVASKLKPKKYGDKIQTEHSGSIGLHEQFLDSLE